MIGFEKDLGLHFVLFISSESLFSEWYIIQCLSDQ